MLLLPNLARLSMRDTEAIDARTNLDRMKDEKWSYNLEAQRLILRHAVEVAWKLKEVTVVWALSVSRAFSKSPEKEVPDEVPEEVAWHLFHAAWRGATHQKPGPEPYTPTLIERLHVEDVKVAMDLLEIETQNKEELMKDEYELLVSEMVTYLRHPDYGMRDIGGVPNIQSQFIMEKMLKLLEGRFGKMVEWPPLAFPAKFPKGPRPLPPRRPLSSRDRQWSTIVKYNRRIARDQASRWPPPR
jgi:hypothetical protein